MNTYTCDIAVIGGGGSGLVAACRAAALGKRVIVLEKDKRLGGGMNMASTMRTFGSKWQKDQNLPDTTALFLRNRMDETYWRLDRKLVGGMLLYPVFMACFLPLQTLALFKTQTIWHEIRHSGVRLAAEVDLRRGKIA